MTVSDQSSNAKSFRLNVGQRMSRSTYAASSIGGGGGFAVDMLEAVLAKRARDDGVVKFKLSG
jgi:hypothetical protein